MIEFISGVITGVLLWFIYSFYIIRKWMKKQ